ncbi:hypothetical protein INT48_006219 [Thamnidium elegans]|uniref:Uncharacterized protein n=1 Tax=Thamnidium elegans TaxID=101142 RepID=A0A8H7SNW8_9FUNG|nr:hypothetical protein INT48_006219 [Thamnidium elegans]
MSENNNNNQTIIHRDQIIDQNDVYNQNKKIQKTAYKNNSDQYESVRLWLQYLSVGEGYNYCIGSNFNINLAFVFLSPLQKNILMQCPYWCLDVTHKTTNIKNGLLYTVVVHHPVTGTGYCFTTSHGVSPIVHFLTFLKDLGCVNVQKSQLMFRTSN